jgi:ribonucleoside-diphosphate reductase alpha chain
MYDDGAPGEVFITIAKEGSTISGLMDAFATAISFNLQYGVPLKFLVDKFAHVRFEPSGWTGNQQIPVCEVHHGLHLPLAGREVPGPRVRGRRSRREHQASPHRADPQQELQFAPVTADAPLCSECGSIMTRNGSCYKCGNCGGTSGCS